MSMQGATYRYGHQVASYLLGRLLEQGRESPLACRVDKKGSRNCRQIMMAERPRLGKTDWLPSQQTNDTID